VKRFERTLLRPRLIRNSTLQYSKAQYSFGAGFCICELKYGGVWAVQCETESCSAFSGYHANFHEKTTVQHSTARSALNAVCVNWFRAFCVRSMGDMVLLEAVRPFPTTTRTFTKNLLSCRGRHPVLSVWINATRYSRSTVCTQSYSGRLWITLTPSPVSAAIECYRMPDKLKTPHAYFHIPKGPCSKSLFLAAVLCRDWNKFVGQCWHALSRRCLLFNFWQMCKQLLSNMWSVGRIVQNITPKLISL
jgi:hypothetical protein